jgi:hypothetical protein
MDALLKQVPLDEIQDPVVRGQVEELRQYLTDLHGWFTEDMGLPLKFRHNYFPLMLDMHRISGNREEFVRILQEVGNFSEEDANVTKTGA